MVLRKALMCRNQGTRSRWLRQRNGAIIHDGDRRRNVLTVDFANHRNRTCGYRSDSLLSRVGRDCFGFGARSRELKFCLC